MHSSKSMWIPTEHGEGNGVCGGCNIFQIGGQSLLALTSQQRGET